MSIDIITNNIYISFSGILEIHKNNPALWMIDLIPFVTVIAIYVINQRREKEKQIFDTRIKEREDYRNKM